LTALLLIYLQSKKKNLEIGNWKDKKKKKKTKVINVIKDKNDD
jgi:hypothetical protein